MKCIFVYFINLKDVSNNYLFYLIQSKSHKLPFIEANLTSVSGSQLDYSLVKSLLYI